MSITAELGRNYPRRERREARRYTNMQEVKKGGKVRNAGKIMDGVKRKIRATETADPKKSRGLTERVESRLQLAREGDKSGEK